MVNKLNDVLKGIIVEEVLNKEDLKLLLFEILKETEFVQKFNLIWSFNLVVGADPVFAENLDENDFFDESKDVSDVIKEVWPFPENYDEWKHTYPGITYGYLLKNKTGPNKILLQVIRFDDNDFSVNINPGYLGRSQEPEIMVTNGMIFRYTGLEYDEPGSLPIINYNDNDFGRLATKLHDSIKTVDEMRYLFRFLDALI